MKRGFTIVEMMIAIGIIGVLSTVVLQQTREARRSGINARIDIYMHQMLQGVQTFYIENDRFPGERSTPGEVGCFGQYPDDGISEGCGPLLYPTSENSTWVYPNNQLFIDEIGTVMNNLPELDKVKLKIDPVYQELLGEVIRGSHYTCISFSPYDRRCSNEMRIVWYKNQDDRSCNAPGAIESDALGPAGSDVTGCVVVMRDGGFLFE